MRKPKYRGYEKLAKVFNEQYSDVNYCFPLAAAIVSGVSAGKARAAFERAGREHRKGTPIPVGMKAMQDLGLQWESVSGFAGQQLRTVAPKLEGKWIVITCSHAVAVVDGKIDDWVDEGSRRKVVYAYKFD